MSLLMCLSNLQDIEISDMYFCLLQTRCFYPFIFKGEALVSFFTSTILFYKSNNLFGHLSYKSVPSLTVVDKPSSLVQRLLTEMAILLMNMEKMYSPVLCSIPLIYDTSNNG